MTDLQSKENAICEVIKNDSNVCILETLEKDVFTDGVVKYFVSKEWLNPVEFSNLFLQGKSGEYFVYLVIDEGVE